MSVVGERITVDNTAGGTVLHTGDSGVSGTRLLVTNADSTNPVSLGPSGVTLAAGYSLLKLVTIEVLLPAGESLYAIAGGSDVIVHLLKTGA